MNRRKKIFTKLKKKDKKAKAKLHKSNKPTYISKAERARLAEQEHGELSVTEKSTKPVD